MEDSCLLSHFTITFSSYSHLIHYYCQDGIKNDEKQQIYSEMSIDGSIDTLHQNSIHHVRFFLIQDTRNISYRILPS